VNSANAMTIGWSVALSTKPQVPAATHRPNDAQCTTTSLMGLSEHPLVIYSNTRLTTNVGRMETRKSATKTLMTARLRLAQATRPSRPAADGADPSHRTQAPLHGHLCTSWRRAVDAGQTPRPRPGA
jgi:hypothetical protein